MSDETREPGELGDGNSANRVIVTKPREWIPLAEVANKIGITTGGLTYRLKTAGKVEQLKKQSGMWMCPGSLAGALYAEGRPSVRSKREKATARVPKSVERPAKTEPMPTQNQKSDTPTNDRPEIVHVCQLLRERIAVLQTALNALHQL